MEKILATSDGDVSRAPPTTGQKIIAVMTDDGDVTRRVAFVGENIKKAHTVDSRCVASVKDMPATARATQTARSDRAAATKAIDVDALTGVAVVVRVSDAISKDRSTAKDSDVVICDTDPSVLLQIHLSQATSGIHIICSRRGYWL